MIRKLRFHHGGTWEKGVIGTVNTHTYKGGRFKDKLEVNREYNSYKKLMDMGYEFLPRTKGKFCSFYYLIGSLRLLIVNDNDLKFMWRNIVPSMDGYTHLHIIVYDIFPQKM